MRIWPLKKQAQLVEKVKSYDPQVNEALITKAYDYSEQAHSDQTRASGDPYFMHPLKVAEILTEMHLDTNTIITGLLHDTVEDTLSTIEEIEENFGKEIAQLVDGVTKLSRIELPTESIREAENFRKFLLAMSNDIRVLLVKLADRLHNMRTLHHITAPEKRRRIALETMEIYAPLAERIGMRKMKDELEDIAFREINPEAYSSINQRLTYLKKKGGNLSKSIAAKIKRLLKKNGIKAQVFGREKTPYSIWMKMERNHLGFEQLSDVIAFRVIIEKVEDCYVALGIIHKTWSMVPGTFDDYISTPKRNGYQSIHTAIIGPDSYRVEIQIRTEKMHEISERGVAAHWSYKQGASEKDGTQYKWLQELLEILELATTPEEFLEHTKLEMFQDQVFCFTPKGDLIPLPRGSTVVDFAYAVHTAVGDTCVGAKVNGRHVPLRHQLENGDRVEILRSKAQHPSPRWEGFVITGKARSAIKRYVRKQANAEFGELGKTILQRAFRQENLEFSEKAITQALPRLDVGKLEDVYIEVGKGVLADRAAMELIFPGMDFKHTRKKGGPKLWAEKPSDPDAAISIKGLTPGMAVHLADCCHPLPGDRIVGLLEKNKGVITHTIDCETLENLIGDEDSWVDLSWQSQGEKPGIFAGRVSLVVVNEAGVLGNIATVVAKHNANISNLKIVDRDPDFFTMLVDIEVRNVKQLTDIITAMRTLSVVSTATRIRG